MGGESSGSGGVIRKLCLTLIVTATALCYISTLLFRLQGGFGGGHLQYDAAVGLAAIPWLWLLERMPSSLWGRGDYIPVVLVPWLLNLTCVALGFSLSRLRHKNPN